MGGVQLPSVPGISEYQPQWGWLDEYEPSQNVNYLNFNKSWLEELEEMERLRNDEDNIGDKERRGAMREIVKSWGETEYCRPQAEMIESVLGGTDIQVLRAESAELPDLQIPVAMVDDRGSVEEHPRKNSGPKTAHELYKLLKKEVWKPFPIKIKFRELVLICCSPALSKQRATGLSCQPQSGSDPGPSKTGFRRLLPSLPSIAP